ncbi:BNR-4 repeat-containing protein [Mucisphaera calidilacus]|uniref:BNR repeat-containing family member n=1 Tax=Mucisphaera calidilacus TaxID=2527982 RepID=A0A518BWT7_9BACT|nr:BNR-4 repeat-containing protein [Mucisphaera calidilacus]QDU71443.1 hypothetical protein Pan265_12930 [Mucisphaera calidilacus]
MPAITKRYTLSGIAAACILVTLLAGSARASEHKLINFTRAAGVPTGAWCWYQDERVVIDTDHPNGPMMLMGSVSFSRTDAFEHGDIDLLWHNLRTGEAGAFELHDRLQPDDHDVPALHIRDDGRYVAIYSTHSSDRIMRWRVSTHPHDPTAWEPEQTYENKVIICYSNIFKLADRDGVHQLYNFSRSDDSDPNYFVSSDRGDTFRYGGKLLTGPDGNTARGQRPYMKYASHTPEKLHFLLTDGHPRDEDNSIYHGYMSRERLHRTDGLVLGSVSRRRVSSHLAPDFTTVLATGAKFNGVEMRHAWTIDLHLDPHGHPVAAMSARANNSDLDHRFLYGRWDGSKWNVFEIAKAGGYLYKFENDYTGLMAIHPDNPDIIFISSPIDPRDDAQLQHYEIFMGRTPDKGATWAWAPVTWNSNADNLRPIVPIWKPGKTIVTWLKGGLNTYADWDSQIVGYIMDTEDLDDMVVPGQISVTRKAMSPDKP